MLRGFAWPNKNYESGDGFRSTCNDSPEITPRNLLYIKGSTIF